MTTWRSDEITIGQQLMPNDVLHIRDGDPNAYQGFVHHSLRLAYEPWTDATGPRIHISMAEGQCAGFQADEWHDVSVPLDRFIDAIRGLAREHDGPWQEFDRKRRELWAAEKAATETKP